MLRTLAGIPASKNASTYSWSEDDSYAFSSVVTKLLRCKAQTFRSSFVANKSQNWKNGYRAFFCKKDSECCDLVNADFNKSSRLKVDFKRGSLQSTVIELTQKGVIYFWWFCTDMRESDVISKWIHPKIDSINCLLLLPQASTTRWGCEYGLSITKSTSSWRFGLGHRFCSTLVVSLKWAYKKVTKNFESSRR